MSRHSKWAKIKRQKAVTDAKRGQLFTKLIRAIGVAAREGGGNPDTNPQLRMEMDRALAANMTKDHIERAIERATGAGAERTTSTLTLEGFGPGGAALLIDAVTDNRNRTVAEVRKILERAGGHLGQAGSVAWQFERRGVMTVEQTVDPSAAELAAIDAGALDIEREDASLDIITAADQLKSVEKVLRAKGIPLTSSQLQNLPKQSIPLDPAATEKLQALIEELEAHEDVVEVVTNAAPPA